MESPRLQQLKIGIRSQESAKFGSVAAVRRFDGFHKSLKQRAPGRASGRGVSDRETKRRSAFRIRGLRVQRRCAPDAGNRGQRQGKKHSTSLNHLRPQIVLPRRVVAQLVLGRARSRPAARSCARSTAARTAGSAIGSIAASASPARRSRVIWRRMSSGRVAAERSTARGRRAGGAGAVAGRPRSAGRPG